MYDLSKITQTPFDYQALLAVLNNYKNPRDKISDLIKSKSIIRIKKGLYILGDNFRTNNYSKEVIANLIFGPSYISLEYALAHYQLIPEKVETLTSVTFQRKKIFTTPVGTFSYAHIPLEVYSIGISRIVEGDRRYLIATKEKALLDKVYFTPSILSRKSLEALLFEDLRLEKVDIKLFDIEILQDIAKRMKQKSIFLCVELIRSLK